MRGPGVNGSLVQQAIQAVSDYIAIHQLRVGDTLPGEKHFSDVLGVSRAVTREAFGALAALRLIDVSNGRKAKVGAIDGSVIATSLSHAVSTAQVTVPEVWDVRRTIEQRTAALAAALRTEAEAAEITALAQAMTAASDDMEDLAQQDIAFHKAIARASHNALFVQIVSSFGPLMEVAVPMAWRTRTTAKKRQAVLINHRVIADAIARGDTEAAAAAMNVHFDSSVQIILQAVAGARTAS